MLRYRGVVSKSDEAGRQQQLLHTLLAGGIAVLVSATLISQLHRLLSGEVGHLASPLAPVAVAILIGLYGLAYLGHYRLSAYLLVGLLVMVGGLAVTYWSIDLPDGLLAFALVIMISGLLVGTRAAVIVSVVVVATVTVVGLLQAADIIQPDVSWLSDGVEAEDTLEFAAILSAVALVGWVANRELDGLLARAKASETALRAERDDLERLVRQRTRQLQQLELERVLELHQLAAVGRMTAGVLHDLVNPITAASLSLQQLSGSSARSRWVRHATTSIGCLERYVVAARKQFQKTAERANFAPADEIQQVVGLLDHKLQDTGVSVAIKCPRPVRLYGDPVRFNHVMLNLIVNAVEAYPPTHSRSDRQVSVQLQAADNGVAIVVEDHGDGIAAKDLEWIFEPFFTTKQAGSRGAGVGLTLVREITEQEFGGSVSATSNRLGTRFRLHLYNYRTQR